MALYRLICALGQQTLVCVLILCGLPLPVYFLADEKHSYCLTDKVYCPRLSPAVSSGTRAIYQQMFLTGLAHLYNLVPYQRRAQHAGQCEWKWKAGEYRHATGSSICKFSPREAFAQWGRPSTTSFGGMWHFLPAQEYGEGQRPVTTKCGRM